MKNKLIYQILAFSIFFSFSSATGVQKTFSRDSNSTFVSIHCNFEPDTLYLRETSNEKDIPVNEYLTDKLKPIRENFNRINSISNWTYIDTHKLRKTTGTGEAKFYYQNGQLEKIITRHFGDRSQHLTEYYLLNKHLSFVFEKSEILEERSYFENGYLIHKIESDDCGASFSNEFLLQEQQRIKSDYTKLIDFIN